VYAALCALGAASCVLTYFVARELLPEPAARLAAVLAAGYVPHVYFATLLLSENLFVPCLALVAWLVLRHLRTGSHASSSAAGLCLGAAILTRPFALLLVPLVFMILVARMWNHRTLRGWSAAAALLLCTAIVVVPWTLRNQRVHHRFVLVATNGGSTFYGGNNDKVAALSPAVGTWVSTRSLPGRDQVDAAPDEVTHDQLEWRLGVDWVREHLSRLPLLLTAKAVRHCLPDVDSANRKYVLLNVLGFTPFLLLMLLGLTRCARDGSLQTVPWMLIHGILLWGSPRFRDANMPILMLYAALGVRKSPEACDG
jgi:4-amino-4-deoxy-L-arabinose transferase-like glycosyltransferase